MKLAFLMISMFLTTSFAVAQEPETYTDLLNVKYGIKLGSDQCREALWFDKTNPCATPDELEDIAVSLVDYIEQIGLDPVQSELSILVDSVSDFCFGVNASVMTAPDGRIVEYVVDKCNYKAALDHLKTSMGSQ